jgi:hypothetical protein
LHRWDNIRGEIFTIILPGFLAIGAMTAFLATVACQWDGLIAVYSAHVIAVPLYVIAGVAVIICVARLVRAVRR